MQIFFPANSKYIRTQKKWTQQEMATALDLKRSTYANYENGDSDPEPELIGKYVLKFGISSDDLLFTDLSKGNLIEFEEDAEKGNLKGNLKPENGTNDDLTAKQRSEQKTGTEGGKTMPHVVYIDEAGKELTVAVKVKDRTAYKMNFRDWDFLSTLGIWRMPDYPGGSYRVFEIEGQEMEPTYKAGDYAIARWVQVLTLQKGQPHVLLTQSHGLLIRRLYPQLQAGKIICKSDNSTPDITVEVKDLREAWIIAAVISKHLPEPGDLLIRLSALEEEMARIKHETRPGLPLE